MDQINKYKQNNHNAGRADRRGRRTKANSKKKKAGGRAQSVTPVANRPGVEILTISNVPSDLLEAIDELASRQDRSRSSFVRRELQRIVAESQAKETRSKL